MEKGTTTLIIMILGLFITTMFVVTLMPIVLTNLTGFGMENISTGIYYNGSTSCPYGLDNVTYNCVFGLQQTVGTGSVFITTIVPLFVIFAIFFLIAQKMGFSFKGGFGGK